MKIKAILLLLIVSISIASCDSKEKSALKKQIKDAEKNLFQDKSFSKWDQQKADSVMNLYLKFANTYKSDTTSADYLFKCAEIKVASGKYKEALELYNRIQTDYPTTSHAPMSLFLSGFTYEMYVSDFTNAKKMYELFIQKYPKHPMRKDAEALIINLGKRPEDILKSFENN